MRLPAGPAANFLSLLHINHFVFATKNQRLIFIRNRKLNVLFKIEEKKENLSENYGLDMDRDLGKEIDDMCNFSDLIEERAIIMKEYNLSPSDAESKMQEYWEN